MAMAATDPDETLMIAYSNGDADAFAELYARHRGALYRFIRRQCSSAVVDELFQGSTGSSGDSAAAQSSMSCSRMFGRD